MAEIELAAAIVVHKNYVLIVRRSDAEKLAPRVWGVPCGKIEKDESPSHAVLRELHEETGLNGEILRPAGDRKFSSVWRGHRVTNLQWNYLVEPKVDLADTDSTDMPRVKLPKRDQEFKWVPIDKIENIDGLDEHNLETIRQGLAVLSLSQGVSSANIASS